MSFITRCPACGTAFKVVSDQLKISEGWVRCGHCQHIFDATLDLHPWQQGGEVNDDDGAASSPEWDETMQVPLPVPVDAVGEPVPEGLDDNESWSVQPSEVDEEIVISAWPDALEDDAKRADGAEVFLASAPPTAEETEPWVKEPLWEPAPELSFVQRAQRRHFWRRPGVRWALALLAVVFLLALVAQLALFYRDALAARVPVLQPLLQSVCQPLGCEIGARRQIEQLSIDSSAMLRRTPQHYAFDMVVKNAATEAVAVPALELSLTDSSDRVVVRKVFLPSDWPQARTVLAPSSDWPVRLEFSLSGGDEAPPFVGYRALLFYP